jgi:pimeloyl-ACP methyl ester carboxylesterase
MSIAPNIVPWLAAALLCGIGMPHQSVAAASTAKVTACKVPGIPDAVRCGSIEVAEDPAQESGRRISIGFAILPATRGEALKDPIAVLMGGPGEDAISMAPDFAAMFAGLRTDRDLLLVDQRGTGRSHALACRMYEDDEAADNLRDFLPLVAVRRCATESGAIADLRQYSYARFASDLEAVRVALGYESLNLYAGSFGTRAAQVFLRAYPRSVRTVYFGSVVPLDVAIPVPLAGAFQAALEKTFAACAHDPVCRSRYPRLEEEFRAVMARLATGVDVKLPGGAGSARLHAGRVAEWLRARLYRAQGAAQLPWLIHQAHEGNYAPLVDGILGGARNRVEAGTAFSFGLFFAITCTNDIPFIDEAEVRASLGTVLGDYRVRQQQAACASWPGGQIPPDHRKPVRSDVPALFVSGDSDPATPLSFTRRVAPNFPNRAEMVLAGRGHTEWTDCVATVYEKFVRTGRATRLNEAACSTPERPAFQLH